MSEGPFVGSNHKTAARWNRGLVLRLIRQHGTLSRRQISQMTGLRGSTLTYIVRELMEKEILRTGEKKVSTSVGQKQVLLNVNPELGHVLGISLRPRTAQLVLMDAAGTRLGMTRFAVSGPLAEMPALIRDGYTRWLASGEVTAPAGRLLAVGLGVPGVVDTEHGIVLNSVGFHSENVPLQEKLGEQFAESLIVIDHDASFGAVAEAADGAAKDTSHFVYFAMNYNRQDDRNSLESFGSALFLEGRVYRGAHFAAGELSGLIAPRRDLVLNEQDLQAFAAEDAAMTPTMQQLAESVGATLASIMNFLDLPLVVLGGNLNLTNTAFVEAVRQRTARSLVPVPGRHLRIEPSKVIGETVARGAAITAVQSVLEGGWLLANDTTAPSAQQAATSEPTAATA